MERITAGRLTLDLHRKKKFSGEKAFAYVCVSLPLIGFILFSLVPLAISFISMFTTMEYYDLSTMTWNEFETFKIVFSDQDLYKSLLVTVMLASSQFISLTVALFISFLLSKKPRGRKIFQILYFIPYICSSVATAYMWMTMFDPNYGIINTFLVGLFGEGARVNWSSDAAAYAIAIIITIVWQAPGYGIVMYKAAFDAVNPSLYEASEIDGASAWKKFWRITFPSIAPTTFFLLMTGIIAGMQTFDIARLFAVSFFPDAWTGTAGPGNIGLTTVMFIYNKGTLYFNIPEASVASWILFVIILTLSLINYRLRKRWVNV